MNVAEALSLSRLPRLKVTALISCLKKRGEFVLSTRLDDCWFGLGSIGILRLVVLTGLRLLYLGCCESGWWRRHCPHLTPWGLGGDSKLRKEERVVHQRLGNIVSDSVPVFDGVRFEIILTSVVRGVRKSRVRATLRREKK